MTSSQLKMLNQLKIDSSQIEKIKSVGATVRAISVNPEILNATAPASITIRPGVSVPGYVDGAGQSLVVDHSNTVYTVTSPPTPSYIPPIPNGGGIIDNGITGNGLTPMGTPTVIGGSLPQNPRMVPTIISNPNNGNVIQNANVPTVIQNTVPTNPIVSNPFTGNVLTQMNPVVNNPTPIDYLQPIGNTPRTVTVIQNPNPVNQVDYLNPVQTITPNYPTVSTIPTYTGPTVVSVPTAPTPTYIQPNTPVYTNTPIVSTPIVTNTPVVTTPITTTPMITTTMTPPPPPNLGSGKIFSAFDNGDIVPNQQELVTRGLWSNNVGNLLTFYTGSTQTDTQKRYYYNIYNSQSGTCGADVQFSIAWGHKEGSGSADEGGQINDTPSRAMYGQAKQLCLNPGEERFTIGGNTTDNIYIINVARARMREYLDEGNLELNLATLSGSKFELSQPRNAHTGSNVKLLGGTSYIRLIDDSKVTTATITDSGEVYNIVSGSLEDGIYNPGSPHYYGLLYRRMGMIILNGDTLDAKAGFLTVTGSEVEGDNSWKLFTAISGAAKFTDTSGDYLGFQGRSAEKVKSTHYFVRVKNQDYNFSNNPSFVTGSEGDLAQPTMIGNPQVYITTVGMYSQQKELLAVAKLSKPIKKNFTKEALIKVRLDF